MHKTNIGSQISDTEFGKKKLWKSTYIGSKNI